MSVYRRRKEGRLKAKGRRPFLYSQYSLTYHKNWKVACDQSQLKGSPIYHNQVCSWLSLIFQAVAYLKLESARKQIFVVGRIQYFWSIWSKRSITYVVCRFLIEKTKLGSILGIVTDADFNSNKRKNEELTGTPLILAFEKECHWLNHWSRWN